MIILKNASVYRDKHDVSDLKVIIVQITCLMGEPSGDDGESIFLTGEPSGDECALFPLTGEPFGETMIFTSWRGEPSGEHGVTDL